MSIVKTFGFSEGLGRDAGTSSPVDTTGSNLIVLAAGYYDAVTAVATVSDSEGNTWTPLTLRTGAFSTACRLWYCLNPTTSATHTFTVTGNHIESGISAIGFSGVGLYDQESGSGNSVRTTTIQPGALTATAPNALYVTTAALEANGYQAIDSGFTISSQVKRSAGNYQFTGIAYFIQTTPAALNPTWSQSFSAAAFGRCAAMATFLAAISGNDNYNKQQQIAAIS